MNDDVREIVANYFMANRRKIKSSITTADKGTKPDDTILDKPELYTIANWNWFYNVA